MSKVLYLYEEDMPTVSITREAVMESKRQGLMDADFVQIHDVTLELVNSADVVYFIRPHDILSVDLARRAHNSGRLVVVMYDDDLLNIPGDTPFAPWRKRYMKAMLETADVVASSSQYILDNYVKRFHVPRTSKIDSVVNEEEFSKYPITDKKPVKLVYAASPKHVGLFNHFILPNMPRLCEKYGKEISLTCVGLYPELDEFKDLTNISIVGGMPLLDYRKFMQEEQFDIGLAPLVTTDFTKCKYFNKYLEYGMANIPGVYSKTEPYTYVIEDGVNGWLAGDSLDDWFEKLCCAIDHFELRKKCAETAKERILANHTMEKVNEKTFADIPELKDGVQNKKSIDKVGTKKLQYKIYKLFEYAYLTLFYLFKTGPKGLVKAVTIHINDRKK